MLYYSNGTEQGLVMSVRVQGEGPLSARIVGIGESPGKSEIFQRRPFVGMSGHKLDQWLALAGLDRRQIRIENVCEYRPPRGDDIESFDAEYLAQWIRYLHERIAELHDPYVLVPMGNYATFALTGKGKVKAAVRQAMGWEEITATQAEKKAGITKLRGSIYQYTDLRGRVMKVVPTVHPAFVLHGPNKKWEKRLIADWRRVKEESETRELHLPRRNHIVYPDINALDKFLYMLRHRGYEFAPLAIDIETPQNVLSCVGFSYNANESIVLPVRTKEERETFMPYVKVLCESQLPKILQNGLFDTYWLREYGIEVNNWQWDTMAMHHALDPIESHSLHFLTSVFTREPYYKDEAKDAEEIMKYAGNLEALYVYNGKDCCVTREIFDVLYGMLVERGMLQFYHEHYNSMFPVLLDTMRHGVRVDTKKQKAWAKRLLGECKEIREELKEVAGEELYAVERKGKWRKPTEDEWEELLGSEWRSILHAASLPLLSAYENDMKLAAPKLKFIDREVAKRLGYVMSRGEIKYYVEKLKKDFSGIKLQRFFYETLGLPKQTRWTKGKGGRQSTITLDEAALKNLTVRFPGKIGKWGLKVLKHREKKAEADQLRGVWDKDGRIRCSYKFTTEAGRLASSKNPMGRGRSLQNIKR